MRIISDRENRYRICPRLFRTWDGKRKSQDVSWKI